MPNDVVLESTAGPQVSAWAQSVGPSIQARTRGLASSIRNQVRGAVPVLTGTLASSVTDSAGEDGGFDIEMGAGVIYAGWIEFGGSRGRSLVPEGRYVYPTAKSSEGEFHDACVQGAELSITKYPWH